MQRAFAVGSVQVLLFLLSDAAIFTLTLFVFCLILATAVTMGLSSLLGVSTLADTPAPAWQGIGILAALLLLHFGWQKWKGKAPSPIAMILVSAVLGMVVYH